MDDIFGSTKRQIERYSVIKRTLFDEQLFVICIASILLLTITIILT